MKVNTHNLIIFDVDGTILDTSQGLLASILYTIQKLKYDIPSEEVLLSFIGPRIQDSLNKVFGLTGIDLEYASNIFRNRYKEKDVLKAEPYEGIYDVLKTLTEKEIHIAIATNKRQDFTDVLLDKFKLGQYVEKAFGTDKDSKLKKEDLIQACLNYFNIYDVKKAVMIGDSSYDAIAASKTGVEFVGVTYGFEFRGKNDVNKYHNIGIAENVSELLEICRNL